VALHQTAFVAFLRCTEVVVVLTFHPSKVKGEDLKLHQHAIEFSSQICHSDILWMGFEWENRAEQPNSRHKNNIKSPKGV
jgi:hypothetical protein